MAKIKSMEKSNGHLTDDFQEKAIHPREQQFTSSRITDSTSAVRTSKLREPIIANKQGAQNNFGIKRANSP